MRVVAAALGLLLCLAVPARAQDDPLHLFLHFTEAAPANFDAAVRVGLQLQSKGFDVVDLRPVGVTMQMTTIRYFYRELRGEAERLKGDLERILAAQGVADARVRVQDFTFFRPKPRPNSLEIWIGTQNPASRAALDRR